MRVNGYFLVLLFLFSCSEKGNPAGGGDTDSGPIDVSGKIYVTDQGSNRVIIIDGNSSSLEVLKTIAIDYDSEMDNCMSYDSEMSCNMASGCEWMMGMCMESTVDCSFDNMQDCMSSSGCEWNDSMSMCMESDSNGGMSMGSIPHFIEIDETNGYWFVTAFGTGEVGMYSLEDDSFISSVNVGSSPALMVLDEPSMTLYVSRMMDMNNGSMVMEGGDNELFVLSYESGSLISSGSINLASNLPSFPSPHALSISSNSTLGNTIYTASNTADIVAKITNNGSSIEHFVIDPNITDLNSGVLEIQRLNPIQSVQSENFVYITCSANSSGQWQADSGDYYPVNGQVVMFNIVSNTLVDIHEFVYDDGYHSPWHMVKSPNSEEIYVTLGSGSVACLEYNEGSGNLSQKWVSSDSGFGILHGITVSPDGSYLYVSSRSNGSVHKINASNGELVYSKNGLAEAGMMGALTGIAIVQE